MNNRFQRMFGGLFGWNKRRLTPSFNTKDRQVSEFRKMAHLAADRAHAQADAIAELYERKNHDYGDAYGKTAQKLGLASALTPINYKIDRLNHLAMKRDGVVNYESQADTLLDLSAYMMMLALLLKENKLKQ